MSTWQTKTNNQREALYAALMEIVGSHRYVDLYDVAEAAIELLKANAKPDDK